MYIATVSNNSAIACPIAIMQVSGFRLGHNIIAAGQGYYFIDMYIVS